MDGAGTGVNLSLDGDVARASRWQLVSVDEDSLVGVARIEGEHPVDGVLLEALAEMARGQGAASGFREKASLGALGLRVSWPGDVLDDDAPFAGRVLGAKWTRIGHVAGADETLATYPVALVELFAVVERIIEFLLLFFADAIHQVVG